MDENNQIIDIMADMKSAADDFIREGLAFVERQKRYNEQIRERGARERPPRGKPWGRTNPFLIDFLGL